jgi:hypothetical protein
MLDPARMLKAITLDAPISVMVAAVTAKIEERKCISADQ